MAVNYVKFMRGTQDLYNSLTTKDSDTLYFIYDNLDATKGKLYLGNKLISGSSGTDENISITDIVDIVVDNNISDGDVLVYNEITQKWENKSLTDIFDIGLMTGATASENGTAGLVPVPIAGDHFKYLRGDGTWAEINTSLSPEDAATINGLQSQVATLIGSDANKSVANIAAEQVAELLIPENAKESLDTLQEIAEWIQEHPNDVADINNSISGIQSDIAVIQTNVGNLEDLLNGTESNPENGLLARVNTIEDTIGNFTSVPSKYLNIGSAINYLDNSITDINDRLRWHELSE